MNLRSTIGNLLPPRIKAHLIDVEWKVKSSLSRVKPAKYLQPILIKPYLARPEQVAIEVTSNCDADCIMCPRRGMSRKVGPMDLDLFKKIVDESVELDVHELALNGYGEISVLKNYQEYLSYIRRKSRTIKININTNAMRMDAERAKYYVDIGVDLINITIDGATAETYESIRRHLLLEQVENNVKQLVEIRNKAGKRRPLVMVQMIHMPQNAHEAEAFLKKWDGVVDRVGISGLYSRIGAVDFVQIDDRKWTETPCSLLWTQMPILSDGSVALCCDDWDGKAPQGNLNKQTIKEIWMSKKRAGLRSLHMAGKAAKIPLCEGCKQPRQGPWWFGG